MHSFGVSSSIARVRALLSRTLLPEGAPVLVSHTLDWGLHAEMCEHDSPVSVIPWHWDSACVSPLPFKSVLQPPNLVFSVFCELIFANPLPRPRMSPLTFLGLWHWGHSHLTVRREILGFVKDGLLRMHLPRMCSSIQNESFGIEDDQTRDWTVSAQYYTIT